MKKIVKRGENKMGICKRFASAALAVTTVAATSTIGFSGVNDVKAAENKLTFTVMCDGTVVQETNGAEAFYKQLEEKLDCNIKWIRPNPSSYYDSVAQTFSSGELPDVVLLNSEYLNYYANKGILWDMTDAWNNSKTKNSGKMSESVLGYVKENGMAYNKYNKKRMFGFSPQRGNGTCTYVKTSYLKTLGYNVDDVKRLTFSYMEYYAMLMKIKRLDPDSYVISSPGFISTQSPYTHYLPEFYEDAKFSFYQNKDGDYVDGFTEQSMRDALERITYAVKEGIIDKDSKDNSTSTARSNFLGRLTTDKSDTRSSKVFSYWNGIWGTTFRNMLELNSDDNDLVVMKPMHPSRYIERRTSTWAIVDKADGRQQLIFDKFIDTMLDGGDVQMLWTYGAKGTHWDTKAETITVRNNTFTYKEGEFHFLPRTDDPNKVNAKNYIDRTLSLRPFDDDTLGGQLDKDAKNINKYYEDLQEETEMFLANSEIEPLIPCTSSYLKYKDEIIQIKKELVDKVALGEMTIDDAMNEYRSKAGSYVDSILEEFKAYSEEKELTVSVGTAEVNNTIRFYAQAEGGKGSYTYKFIVYNKTTGTWGLIQNYSSSRVCTWTKGSAGDRDFYVDVKDSTGKVVRSKAINVKIESDKPTSVLTPSATTVSAGDKFTLTASTNKSGCTYKFLIYNPSTNQWFKLQDFGSKNTYTWTAGSEGTRQFYVDVKDSDGNVTRSKVVNVTIGSSGALSVKTTVSAKTSKPGDKITFTAEGSGGKAGYTYKMVVYNKTTKTWGLVQNFNANNKITWTAGSAGDREFYIDVKDASGKVVRSSVMNVKTSN